MDKLAAAATICILFLCLTMAGAAAQTNTITPADAFPIPQLGSQIQFAEDLNYTSAALENNTWYFTGLKAGGYAGAPIRGHLHISATNCTVTINSLQGWNQPEIGSVGLEWVTYSVAGAGTQTFDGNDLFPNSDRWMLWSIKIDGKQAIQGIFWNITYSKQLTVTTTHPQSTVEIRVFHTPPDSDEAPLPTPAPALVNFTSANHFDIPKSNGSVSFAIGGSYDAASLNADTWRFTNLTLNNYFVNAGMFAPNVTGRDVLPYIYQFDYPADLSVSAKDSNITISGITPLTWHSGNPGLNYTVQGTGIQTFTFPFELKRFNWTVAIDGVPRQEGDGWHLLDNNQINVNSATSAVTIKGNYIETHIHPVYIWPVFQIIIVGATAAIAITAFVLYRRHHATASRKLL